MIKLPEEVSITWQYQAAGQHFYYRVMYNMFEMILPSADRAIDKCEAIKSTVREAPICCVNRKAGPRGVRTRPSVCVPTHRSPPGRAIDWALVCTGHAALESCRTLRLRFRFWVSLLSFAPMLLRFRYVMHSAFYILLGRGQVLEHRQEYEDTTDSGTVHDHVYRSAGGQWCHLRDCKHSTRALERHSTRAH